MHYKTEINTIKTASSSVIVHKVSLVQAGWGVSSLYFFHRQVCGSDLVECGAAEPGLALHTCKSFAHLKAVYLGSTVGLCQLVLLLWW